MSDKNWSTSGRGVLNWSKNTYTSVDDVDESFRDYHMQGIGNITGVKEISVCNVTFDDIDVTFEDVVVTFQCP